jgi:cytochrome c oxidase subunit 2
VRPLLLAANHWGSPNGITTQDRKDVLPLWNITYYFAVPLGLLVIGLTIWCVVRYRARKGEDRIPSQFQYHIPLEAAYTIIPIVIVLVVFGYMYKAEDSENNISSTPALVVRVDGFQWGWRFSYPNGYQVFGSVANEPDINAQSLPTLTLPAGETVQLNVYSEDVNHSFYVPEFLFKRDLIQGINNSFDINIDPTKTGRYIGECTQFCGTYHPLMRFWLQVLPKDQFTTWLAHQHGTSSTGA